MGSPSRRACWRATALHMCNSMRCQVWSLGKAEVPPSHQQGLDSNTMHVWLPRLRLAYRQSLKPALLRARPRAIVVASWHDLQGGGELEVSSRVQSTRPSRYFAQAPAGATDGLSCNYSPSFLHHPSFACAPSICNTPAAATVGHGPGVPCFARFRACRMLPQATEAFYWL